MKKLKVQYLVVKIDEPKMHICMIFELRRIIFSEKQF